MSIVRYYPSKLKELGVTKGVRNCPECFSLLTFKKKTEEILTNECGNCRRMWNDNSYFCNCVYVKQKVLCIYCSNCIKNHT